MVKKKRKAKKKHKKKPQDSGTGTGSGTETKRLDQYTEIDLSCNKKIIDSSDSFHVTTFDRKNHNIHIDVESVKIPININFCQIKNEDIDDIESILKKIEGTLPEVSTKQIYPNNYVWADWSTQ